MSDPLVEIHRTRWPELRDSFMFMTDYPIRIAAYNALDSQIRYPDLEQTFDVKVYCPYGEIRNGVIMTQNKGALEEVIVLPNQDDTEKLEEALIRTQRIDWSHEKLVPWADTEIVRLMKRVCSRTNLVQTKAAATIKHVLKKGTKPYENMVPPPDTYTGSLTNKHIEQVDKVWPHRYATSYNFFEALIRNGLSYGLFSAKDDSLLAWCFICEAGFLTHLYCEEQYRSKGYAEYITKVISNDQLLQGKDIIGYVVEGNVRPFGLYRKLDYEVTGRGVWMFFKSDTSNLIEKL